VGDTRIICRCSPTTATPPPAHPLAPQSNPRDVAKARGRGALVTHSAGWLGVGGWVGVEVGLGWMWWWMRGADGMGEQAAGAVGAGARR